MLLQESFRSRVVTIYQLYKKSSVVTAIRSMSLGILLALFVAGWSMPKLNPYLGWRALCEKTNDIYEEQGMNEYWVYRISLRIWMSTSEKMSSRWRKMIL